MRFRLPFMRKSRTKQGYTAKSYRGIQVARENHADGSVTICKEMVDGILEDPRVPDQVKALFRFTPAKFMLKNDDYYEGPHAPTG